MERLLSGGRRVGTVHGAYMRTSLCTFWTQTLGCFGADDGISSSLTLHIFPGGGPPETNGRETLEAGDCVGLRACCVWDDARYSMAARVFCLGSQFPAPMDALWAAACEAQRAAARAIRPGACLQAAADAANAVLRARGCCADESRFLFAIGCARQVCWMHQHSGRCRRG